MSNLITMAKITTCGVIVTDGENILGCLPTGRVFKERNCLDLPKGRREQEETSLDCALRELREETGLTPEAKELQFVGSFPYRPTKDLDLFLWKVVAFPDLSTLSCDSQFMDHRGDMVSEHCGYEKVRISDINKRFFISLADIIPNYVSYKT